MNTHDEAITIHAITIHAITIHAITIHAITIHAIHLFMLYIYSCYTSIHAIHLFMLYIYSCYTSIHAIHLLMIVGVVIVKMSHCSNTNMYILRVVLDDGRSLDDDEKTVAEPFFAITDTVWASLFAPLFEIKVNQATSI
jgi:hypothetical protein